MAAFLDEAKINIKAGSGGRGAVAFFHKKGGGRKKIACGGNGGSGGDVIIQAASNIGTLYGFRKKVHFRGEDGTQGMSNNRSGRDGDDLVIKVPVGTIVRDNDGTQLADLDREASGTVIAKGGIGGRGNASFVSQSRRFPGFAEKGEETADCWIRLELRLLADAALVGFPNAGKSTIISRISAARPKIADYPFTTLVPNLGVVVADDEDFVVADIPGLIEGAHRGVGLGDKFLRHITRSTILVYVLDGALLLRPEGLQEILNSYDVLRKEIRLYNIEVYKKDFIVVLNKSDILPDRGLAEEVKKGLGKRSGNRMLVVSAVSGDGMEKLVSVLHRKISDHRERAPGTVTVQEKKKNIRMYRLENDIRGVEKIDVQRIPEGYIIKNKILERMVQMTDLENSEALDYLKNCFKKMKVAERLKEMGIKEGSIVIIGSLVFDLVE